MSGVSTKNSFHIKSQITGSYKVSFLENLSKSLKSISKNEKIIFLIDKKLFALFKSDFKQLNNKSRIVEIESSEENKTIDYSKEVIRKLIDLNIRKDDKLIAVGGGITQDITAFISSIIFRGVKWIFYPSTLLAQCDSCIGSKSSINFDQFKNLLGTFNPPEEVYIFPGFLNTLTESEIRSGIGEMLHYFLTDGVELARKLTDDLENLIEDRSRLAFFIDNSLRIKKRIIEIDEFDISIRHIFNYGHTFGHALEAITNYKVPHGQAVTLGIDLANYISHHLGRISSDELIMMHNILKKNIPSFSFNEKNIADYLEALSKDKKNQGTKIGCILPIRPGEVEKVFIDNNGWLKNCIIRYSNDRD